MADIQVANTDADLSGNTVVTEENAYTITGLHTFSRSTNAPFACISGSAVVTYLDADKLDGQEGAYYLAATNATGTLAVNRGGTGAATFTDGGVLLGSGTSAITATAVLGDGVILIGDASGDPTTLDVGSSSGITILGTIATGVWQGTDVGVAYGGTGVSTLTDGGVLLGNGTGGIVAMSVLADSEMIVGDGTTDPVAESGATLRTSIGVGTGDSPQFTGLTVSGTGASALDVGGGINVGTGDVALVGTDGKINGPLSSTIIDDLSGANLTTLNASNVSSGTLAVARGGTGAGTFTDGGVLLGSGTGAITATAVLGDGVILIGDASGDPTTLDVGSSTSITILGTVATGVWQGTAVADAYVANDLTISGGTVNNSVIGGSTAAAATVTTLNTTAAVVFNDAGADVDFRVEGDTDQHLLFVDASTDRVGIGAALPDGTLHVHTATAGSITAVADGDDLVVENSGNTGITIFSGTGSTGNVYFGDSGDADVGRLVYNHNGEIMSFWTSGSQWANIASNGYFGIGDESPDRRFSVRHDSAGAQEQFRLENGASAGANVGSGITFSASGEVEQVAFVTGWNAAATTDAFFAIRTRGSSSNTERLRINSVGNCGLGTSSPTSRLHLSAAGADIGFEISRTGGGAEEVDAFIDGGGDFRIQVAGAHAFGLYTTGTERLRIAAGGDVILQTGVLALKETSTPTAVAAYGRIYTKDDDKLYFQDGAGAEHELAFA